MTERSKTHETCESMPVWPGMEFACWVMVLLFPWLYWINGPAVSTDQFVVRTVLVVLTVALAIGLRVAKLRGRSVR